MSKELNNEIEKELNKNLNNALWNKEALKEYETVFVTDSNKKYIYYKNTLIKCTYDRNGDRDLSEATITELEQDMKALRTKQLEVLANESDINVIKSSYDLYTKSITKAYKFLSEHKEEIIEKERKEKTESLLALREESIKNLTLAVKGLNQLGMAEDWKILCNGEVVLDTIAEDNNLITNITRKH